LSDSPVAVEQHGPELLHHFADAEQQRNAASLGMWIFLGTEIMFFGGMFCAYLIYRLAYYNEFAVASRTLSLPIGTINTAVLICSSLTVALSVRAAQLGKQKLIVVLLVLTLLFGLAFLGIKGYEWREKFVEHHVPGSSFSFDEPMPGHPEAKIDPRHAQIFFSLYFAMTGMHALHMIIGVGIFGVLIFMAWRGRFTPEYHTPVEIGGLYWHFVDIVWIYLFPLLYLMTGTNEKADSSGLKPLGMTDRKLTMSEHILPSKLYWAIWAILICLTVVTALVATVDLGWLNPVAALLIATGKATIVVLFFMHVKYTSEKLTAMVIVSALFWLLILLTLSLADYSTRPIGYSGFVSGHGFSRAV